MPNPGPAQRRRRRVDPQSLNRYAYVRNNPLKYTDPSGHVEMLDWDSSGWWTRGPRPQRPHFWANFLGEWGGDYLVAVQTGMEGVGVAFARVLNGSAQEQRALIATGDRLVTPREVFEAVYGRVTFQHVDEYPVDNKGNLYWAESFTRGGQEIIEVYNWAFDADSYTFHNPGHELGHAFAHRTGGRDGVPRVPYDDLGKAGVLNGAYNPPGPWNQNSRNSNSENFADLFLSWPYYPSSPITGDLYQWMNGKMPYWIALAVSANQ